MSRALSGLVALALISPAAHAVRAQTFVIQGPDGAVGVGAVEATVALPGLPNQPPPRDAAPARTGTSRIRGRVVLADTGQPARRATVRVTGGDLRQPASTTTDADGRYEIVNLPSGRYSLSASKSTYLTINYGQTRPMETGRPLEIGDNQIVEKVDFSLPRGGVIAGRIVDEYGEPVANAMVQPMQIRLLNGEQRPLMSGTPFTTSDTGEYRLWGLSPGQYYVSVNPRSIGAFMMDDSDSRAGYAPTYYPSAASAAEAQPITVTTGQTAGGVDIMLMPTRTSRVSGTAIDGTGQPARMGMVMAMQRGVVGMMSPSGAQLQPDGSFVISGLAPGDYVLRATIPQIRSGGGPPEMLVANVTVAGADVTGVVLAPVQPAVVRGRVLFEPPASTLQPSMIQIMALPSAPDPSSMLMAPGPAQIGDDFTFELKASPGRTIVRASVSGAAASAPWVVKSIRHDMTDVTDSALDLTAGREIDGLEIVLTSRVQLVSGQITDARNELVTDATVMIFAQDRERWTGATRYQAVARPDQNGRYTTQPLPPGDYFAIAVSYPDPARGRDPEYLEQLIPEAVRFTLREEESKALDLKLAIQR